MSKMIDRARIAVAEIIQQSNLPVGSHLDSEKIVRAVIKALREISPAVRENLEQHADHDVQYWHGELIDVILNEK